MPHSSLLIPAALLLPPTFVSGLAGWLATRGENARKRFLVGGLITVGVAILYYGLLAALAGVNAFERDPAPAPVFIVVILLGIVAVLAAVCFGVFWGFVRLFKRIGRREQRV